MKTSQREDLLGKWSLSNPSQQDDIIEVFMGQNPNKYTMDSFLDYLRKKLEIDGYWRRVGLV